MMLFGNHNHLATPQLTSAIKRSFRRMDRYMHSTRVTYRTLGQLKDTIRPEGG